MTLLYDSIIGHSNPEWKHLHMDENLAAGDKSAWMLWGYAGWDISRSIEAAFGGTCPS